MNHNSRASSSRPSNSTTTTSIDKPGLMMEPEQVNKLASLLRLPEYMPAGTPPEVWLNGQLKAIETPSLLSDLRHNPHKWKKLVAQMVFPGLSSHHRRPEACWAHKHLNQETVFLCYSLLQAECLRHVEYVQKYWTTVGAEGCSGVMADFLELMLGTASLWAGKAHIKWYNDSGFNEHMARRIKFRPACVESGCPACVLAVVGGRRQVLISLRASMMSRKKPHRPKPRLLQLVDAWIDQFGPGGAAQSRYESRRLMAELEKVKSCVKRQKKLDRSDDGKSGRQEQDSIRPSPRVKRMSRIPAPVTTFVGAQARRDDNPFADRYATDKVRRSTMWPPIVEDSPDNPVPLFEWHRQWRQREEYERKRQQRRQQQQQQQQQQKLEQQKLEQQKLEQQKLEQQKLEQQKLEQQQRQQQQQKLNAGWPSQLYLTPSLSPPITNTQEHDENGSNSEHEANVSDWIDYYNHSDDDDNDNKKNDSTIKEDDEEGEYVPPRAGWKRPPPPGDSRKQSSQVGNMGNPFADDGEEDLDPFPYPKPLFSGGSRRGPSVRPSSIYSR
ncbi:hypothetical protein B0H66DRAFT_620290 [Apodospora peruviana]|uniref:Uncharacterized protein n=1 Tax=Apodospora peruviana TaxID=516989 RepID=A0AAE0ICT1_9PEZI|nr:hypothetical protein B0H66DRAFT_620290 [Apodospora peruviana]